VAEDGDQDGIPVALLEAMSVGLPVITTAVAGIPEVVDDQVGWLIPADQPEALDEALRAARDPVERQRRGHAARERLKVQRRTVERQVDDLLAAWGVGARRS
jgi:colanic acid/amylovoran biosynthesis glycosyltransferase